MTNSSLVRQPAGSSLAHAHQPESALVPCQPAELRRSASRLAVRAFVSARHDLGLTQVDMATTLGVSDDTIGRWESGRTTLPAWALAAANALLTQVLGRAA
ncbi:MAG TPA: helix-turn-helix transcriptional regulator [Polyangiaceae bacterium]|nr:helix-turn-helix transcriptional regulator [Polyangiaceae bacterium]